jgi:hypothetical protein
MSDIISLFSNNTQVTFQRQEDGYINATALCKSVGREFHTWNRSKTTIAFINELSYDTHICGTDLVQIQQGGEPHLQGTWVHPLILIDIAMWLSMDFKYQAMQWLQDNLLKYRDISGDDYKKLSTAICQKINPAKAGIIIPEIATKIKEHVGVDDWNKATELELKRRTQIQKDIILLCKTPIVLQDAVKIALENN